MARCQLFLHIGDHADDADAGTGVIRGGRVAYRNHLLGVVLLEKEVDRLIQLRQFLLDVKDLKRAGKGFDFDHCSPPCFRWTERIVVIEISQECKFMILKTNQHIVKG